jgi:urea transport system permease protein
MLGNLFYGISLGSVLLLARSARDHVRLMRVINMAHGELLMIGAYSTFASSSFFEALSASSTCTCAGRAGRVRRGIGAIGMALERTVIPLPLRPAARDAAARPGAFRWF